MKTEAGLATESEPARSSRAKDDIEIAGIFKLLWTRRLLISGITILVTAAGIAYALLASPIFYSQATIALKDTGKGADASRLFAQFGGMGGMVASQLGVGNTNLEKMDVILKGHELAEAVIRKNDLLPVLLPKAYVWKGREAIPKNPARAPTVWEGIRAFKNGVLVVNLDLKKSMIRVGMNARDSVLAKRLVDLYLEELNAKIRRDVISDADTNRAYLERQLINTTDPILMEKIHSMISFEIEKAMLVSSRAFEILEKPIVPYERSKPKRKTIVILAFLTGLFGSIVGVFLWKGLLGLR